uniref:Immunoglobulin V-set domain-containing protein n=1 Tax=Oryzias melastigma TaxID=30732 RepID=A0A3B3D266_ORYME
FFPPCYFYVIFLKQSLQNGAQCYGALGGSVFLQLMDDFTEIDTYQLLTQNMIILAGGKDRALGNEMKTRSSFFPSNGTFLIRNLSINDSGEYTLYTFDSKGEKAKPRTLQLMVQGKYFFIS